MNEETDCNGMAHDLAARNELQTDLALCLAVPEGLTDRTSKTLGSMPSLYKAKEVLPEIVECSKICVNDCPMDSADSPDCAPCVSVDAWNSR